MRLDGERADSDLPPPALGEHSREILSDLGDEEFVRLREAGVVG